MDATKAVEQHNTRQSALQRSLLQTGQFAQSLARISTLTILLTPILLLAFLTIDLPMRAFDLFFWGLESARPSNWLSKGAFFMAFAPFVVILMARKYGGDEASRAVTAAWGVAAIATFAELSYLAPQLEAGDLPRAKFVMAFVASAMGAQYIAAGVYDVSRGGLRWWRAPLYAMLSASLVYVLVYFPWVYWGTGVPWANWMIGDFAVKTFVAFLLLPIYGFMRSSLRPKGGFGGR